MWWVQDIIDARCVAIGVGETESPIEAVGVCKVCNAVVTAPMRRSCIMCECVCHDECVTYAMEVAHFGTTDVVAEFDNIQPREKDELIGQLNDTYSIEDRPAITSDTLAFINDEQLVDHVCGQCHLLISSMTV